ncbi:MAG: hypothetical protein M1829_000422, partial [Trizodia sp. TS-e1964]
MEMNATPEQPSFPLTESSKRRRETRAPQYLHWPARQPSPAKVEKEVGAFPRETVAEETNNHPSANAAQVSHASLA